MQTKWILGLFCLLLTCSSLGNTNTQENCNQPINAVACYQKLKSELGGHPVENSKYVAHIFNNACAMDEAQACANLGKMFFQGKQNPQDLDRARTYLVQGCTLKNTEACNQLIELGVPSEKDIEMTAKLNQHQALCSDKNTDDCVEAAKILLVMKQGADAVDRFQTLCKERKHTDSCDLALLIRLT